MKKKQILAMGMSAALLCAGSAFAADAEKVPATPVKTESEKAVTGTEATEVQMDVRIGAMVSVTSVQKEADDYKFMLVKTEKGEEIQLNLDQKTLVVNNETGVPAAMDEIKAGDKVFVYYSPVMTRSLPPQSACELILVNVGDKTPASLHEVGTVNREEYGKTAITTAAGDMIIRVDGKTAMSALKTKDIVTAESLTAGTRFLAWYDVVAMSYPGQAYTEKLVVLPTVAAEPEGVAPEAKEEPTNAAEAAETETPMEELKPAAKPEETKPAEATELTVIAGDKTLATKASVKDGKAVIAVREVAEALGFDVDYVQKDGKEYVTIKNDTRTMTLEIGVDSYVSVPSKEGMVGMATPEKYGVAPYIVEDRTYAAAELFEAMMGFDVEVKDDTVTISVKK